MTEPAPNLPPKKLPWVWTALLLALLPGVVLAIYFGGVLHRVDDHPPAVKKKVAGHRKAAPTMRPAAMEPQVMKPEAMEPEVMKPEAMEPEVMKPEVMEPEVMKPEVMKPAAMKVPPSRPTYPRPPSMLRDLEDPFAMRPARIKAMKP